MTDEYIDTHFDEIKKHASVIETRLLDMDFTPDSLKSDNHYYIDSFTRNGEYVTLIETAYEDSICELLQIERIKWMEHRFNNALAAIKDGSAVSLKAVKEDVAELSKYYGSELWKQDFAADEAGVLPPDLKRGVLSEDGIWNLLSDYREIQKKKQ
jgi:hypothetical protein